MDIICEYSEEEAYLSSVDLVASYSTYYLQALFMSNYLYRTSIIEVQYPDIISYGIRKIW